MQRRKFISGTVLSAMAVSAPGFIRFNGIQFEGDCETTTDILGTFYRPDAPVRSDLRMANAAGQPVVLTGQVKHKDCTTALKGACVELWHCDGKGVYDNDSPAFLYRAKTFCDDKGNYNFKTILPVPYDVGNGSVRPAHFHMMISAPGYQSLITQLYFNGDKYIDKDQSASSPAAKRRILPVKEGKNNEKLVTFNVSMLAKMPPDPVVLERLSGAYLQQSGTEKYELFVRDNMLWVKHPSSINGGYALQYNGENKFELFGNNEMQMQFTILTDGAVKVLVNDIGNDGKKTSMELVKKPA
jgi:protocatechuate 3,4-dioxygenase beta subunit